MSRETLENSYLYGANSVFIEELYSRYLTNAASVDPSWQKFFASLGDPAPYKPSWDKNPSKVIGQFDGDATLPPKKDVGAAKAGLDPKAVEAAALDALRAQALIRAYRVRGHLMADLDPLDIEMPQMHADLDPASYGFSPTDYDREVYLGGQFGMERAKLGDLLAILQQTYSGTLGVEFMHIQDPKQREWIQSRIEAGRGKMNFTVEQKKNILRSLLEV